MSIEIKETTKQVKSKEITTAYCDNCQTPISELTLLEEGKQSIILQLKSEKLMNGVHQVFVPGYGTKYDSSKFEITLCTECYAEVIIKFGGSIIQ